ncbi:MAG: zf-TFIIB domain-containing protein [Dehalococcoidia bacterium]|nr:zf-TFIIB domain-containing protein [Dehalococcoidia bacterium]
MIVVEHEKIELDYCTKCLGVWFDAGELALLLESLDLDVGEFNVSDILTLPEKEIAEKKRRCPVCRKKMRKAAVGHEPEVVIDVCPRGEGMWFDGGEVGQVIKQRLDKSSAESGAPDRVVNFLGEVFQARE